jgi:hypothetical protein
MDLRVGSSNNIIPGKHGDWGMNLNSRTINPNKKIVIARRLPVPGEVLVQRGQQVAPLQVIARAEIAGRCTVINIAEQLGQPDVDMSHVLLKSEGDAVAVNELLATNNSKLPFSRRVVKSPVQGYITAIQQEWVSIESEPSTVELNAFIHGVVAKIIPGYGAIIETGGAMITARCGFGGETYGPLKRLVNNPIATISADDIQEGHKNSILLAGRTIDLAILRKAHQTKVRGLIVGSFDASLRRVKTGVVVVATEGFGNIPVSPYTFGLLATLTGKDVSLRGNSPELDLGGVAEEPPLIVTSTATGSRLNRYNDDLPVSSEPGKGSRVRIIRGPMMGTDGIVDSIPAEPQQTETGLVTPGGLIKIDNASYYIPWANLEQIV